MPELYRLGGKRVWVAGHGGMVGSALVRRLQKEDCEILTAGREIDLRNQALTYDWIADRRPDLVFLAAAKVGGILANSLQPADFLFDNLAIEMSVVAGCFKAQVEKLVFLGSSCIYPKFCPQPIVEESLLTGSLEPTNEWYAIAKIAGIKLCQAFRVQHGVDYISAMPTNLYGPGDNFDLGTSHVMPALIRKAHEAKMAQAEEMVIWGSGSPRREFLHVDDCADALVHLAKTYSDEVHINVGSGTDMTILELAQTVCAVVGFEGCIINDMSKPDGTPCKLMSAERLRTLGWSPTIKLTEGIRSVYSWFLQNAREAQAVRAEACPT